MIYQLRPQFYFIQKRKVGDSGVGKFHINQFLQGKPTIGVDLKVKMMKIRNKRIKLTIWDTAGQERFRTLTSAYYRGAHGIILVYDITNRESFNNIEMWLKEVDLYSTSDKVVKLLVGNKLDKEEERVVHRIEGLTFAKKYNMLFIETSAKTSEGCHQSFEELTEKIMDIPQDNMEIAQFPLNEDEEYKSRGCCG